MSSFKQIFYHIVFDTKERQKTLTDSHSSELYKYIWGIVKNHNCHLYRINGAEDNIHLRCDLRSIIHYKKSPASLQPAGLCKYILDMKIILSASSFLSHYFPPL